MKKLLSILAAVGLTATASAAVVACTSIQHFNNPIDADGNITFKTNVPIEFGVGTQLTAKGDYYTFSDLSKLGDGTKANNPTDGIAMLNAPENHPEGTLTPDKNSPEKDFKDWEVNNGVTWEVKKSDVKSGDTDKNNKVTKSFTAEVTIIVPAKANGIWEGYYSQSLTWTIVSLANDKEQGKTIKAYVDVLQMEIPATNDPVIHGVGTVNRDAKTITFSGRNLYKASKDDLSKIMMDGQPLSGVKVSVVNGNLQISGSDISAGNHIFSFGAKQTISGKDVYNNGPILGSGSVFINK